VPVLTNGPVHLKGAHIIIYSYAETPLSTARKGKNPRHFPRRALESLEAGETFQGT